MAHRKRIGEILIEAGRLTETQLSAALHSQATWGGKLGSTLVRMGFVREEEILQCLSAQLRLPSVDFGKVKISALALKTVSVRVADKYSVIPVAVKEEQGKRSVILAMADPTDLDAVREIEFQTGMSVRPVVAAASSISRAIDHYYRGRKFDPVPDYRGEGSSPSPGPTDEMVIIRRGEETTVSTLDGVEPADLLRALIRVLEEKGVVGRQDLERVLRRRM